MVGEKVQIGLQLTGVVTVVGVVVELQRIDENAGDHDVAVLPGGPQQRRVARVQRTHGRHQPEHGGGCAADVDQSDDPRTGAVDGRGNLSHLTQSIQ